MGAVRKFPRKKMPWHEPCVPASEHKFVEVQRSPVKEKVEGDYVVIHRCDKCGNSLYVQTKRYNRATLMNPKVKRKKITQG